MDNVMKRLSITNRLSGQLCQSEIVLLTFGDWQRVAALQQDVMQQLPEPELFFPLEESEIQEVLSTKGITVGALVDGRLIGFSSILFPGISEDNVGIDLELASEELAKVAYLKAGSIHPDFRGNSLQIQMVLCLWEEALQRKEWVHFCSTVSPKNYASLAIVFGLGLVVVKLKRKYRNYWRYIFYLNKSKPLRLDEKNTEIVRCEDIERQAALLQQGYYGYRFVKDTQSIVFGKEIRK